MSEQVPRDKIMISPDLKQQLLNKRYEFVEQDPDVTIRQGMEGYEYVLVEGTPVRVPFTNMSGFVVVVRKEGDKWQYIGRAQNEEIEGFAKSLIEQEA